MVQQFTEAFVQALQMPDGPTSDSGLKMEVLKVRNSALGPFCRTDYDLQTLSQSFSFLFVCGYFPGFKSLFSLLIRLTGSDSIGKELPQTHGVLHAADITHCVEYTD